ncbi:MAG: sugar transferase [Actinomycetota bacterium]
MTAYDEVGGRAVAGPRGRAAALRRRRVHLHAVLAADVLAVTVGTWVGYATAGPLRGPGLGVALAVLPVLWLSTQLLVDGYAERALRSAVVETRRVLVAALTVLAILAVVEVATRASLLRGLVLVGVPLLTLCALGGRWLVRYALTASPARALTRRALVVGDAGSLSELLPRLGRAEDEVRVVAACVDELDRASEVTAHGVPVAGTLTDVPRVARALGCDVVVVVPGRRTRGRWLGDLSWALLDSGIEILMVPSLVEVAPTRLALHELGGISAIRLDAPTFLGQHRLVKAAVDRVVAAAALALLAPVLAGIALLIRWDSPGPVLFRQQRVGRDGRLFTMLKFRTMVIDAEARRGELAHLNERSEGLLFKIRQDPRITRVGRLLRRFSLDELPQLVNVLAGAMSLVGPRPPLPEEAARYDEQVRRRLRVKPGLTGAWQVSGRSDLPWDEAVRLDVGYVENWSLGMDAEILLRTGSAVVRGTGAY